LGDGRGPLTDLHRRVIVTLELARVETLVGVWRGLPGRPPSDRAALARAFVAKAVMGIPTTKMLIERLTADKQLRRLCGWERPGQVPTNEGGLNNQVQHLSGRVLRWEPTTSI
jgi:hypothetical protein